MIMEPHYHFDFVELIPALSSLQLKNNPGLQAGGVIATNKMGFSPACSTNSFSLREALPLSTLHIHNIGAPEGRYLPPRPYECLGIKKITPAFRPGV